MRVSDAVDAGVAVDAETARLDAGVWPVDAGPERRPDAGTPPDAGAPLDAGAPTDAGVWPDAGPVGTPDAGLPARECYSEPFDPTVPLGDLEASFRGSRAFDAVLEAMRRRYPGGYDLLVAEQGDPYTGSFVDRSSFGAAMETSMTEVHEATHGWDYGHALFPRYFGYWINGAVQHVLTFDVDGFPRSELRGMLEDRSTDLYSGTYLTGEQGTRGFLELLDETNCYINGLGAIAAIADEVPYGISGRDGAVAFLYYVQLYLRRARTQAPGLYATMQADADLVEHVKLQWLRTHFFLMFADQHPHVGIRDDDIRALLYAPANLQEISGLIGRCVDDSPCLCD